MPRTTGNGLFFGGGFTLLISQLIGVVTVGAFTFAISFIVWTVLKKTMGIRVSEAEEVEEVEGLDIGEHGMEAYPEFGTGRVDFGDHGSGGYKTTMQKSYKY